MGAGSEKEKALGTLLKREQATAEQDNCTQVSDRSSQARHMKFERGRSGGEPSHPAENHFCLYSTSVIAPRLFPVFPRGSIYSGNPSCDLRFRGKSMLTPLICRLILNYTQGWTPLNNGTWLLPL